MCDVPKNPGHPDPISESRAMEVDAPRADRRAFLRDAGTVSLICFTAGGLTFWTRVAAAHCPARKAKPGNPGGSKRNFKIELVLDGIVVIKKARPSGYPAGDVDRDHVITVVKAAVDDWITDYHDSSSGSAEIHWTKQQAHVTDYGTAGDEVQVDAWFEAALKVTEKAGGDLGLDGDQIAPYIGERITGLLGNHAEVLNKRDNQCSIGKMKQFAEGETGDEEVGIYDDGEPIKTC